MKKRNRRNNYRKKTYKKKNMRTKKRRVKSRTKRQRRLKRKGGCPEAGLHAHLLSGAADPPPEPTPDNRKIIVYPAPLWLTAATPAPSREISAPSRDRQWAINTRRFEDAIEARLNRME